MLSYFVDNQKYDVSFEDFVLIGASAEFRCKTVKIMNIDEDNDFEDLYYKSGWDGNLKFRLWVSMDTQLVFMNMAHEMPDFGQLFRN